MTSNIYDQHRAAFAQVSAYVILKDGERVATIAFKYPRDGAGRLYAYVHWIGIEMTRGHASGGGYDKATAACASAVNPSRTAWQHPVQSQSDWPRFSCALYDDRGSTWESALRSAGFTVLRAI